MGGGSATARKRGPKSALGNDPRTRIHDAALACFEERGVKATTMDDVAVALGVSRPTVYHYFAGKDDLVLEVVTRQVQQMLEITRRRLRGKGMERIGQAAYLTVVESRANPYVRLLVEAESGKLVPRFLATERVREIVTAFWAPLLTHAQSSHGLRTDRPVDEMIQWIMFNQLALVAGGAGFGLDDDGIRDWVFAYLIPSLRG
jgi:AcrR family transcriptional regulator